MSLNSHRFNNGIKAIVRDMQQQVPDSTEFMPTSYDQKTHRVKGYFIQSGKESAWLSILSPFLGAGWSLLIPPVLGIPGIVMPTNGNINDGMFMGHYHTDSNAAPTQDKVEPGELYLRHASGTILQLTNGGDFNIIGHNDVNITTTTGNLNVSTKGNVNIAAQGQINIDASGQIQLTSTNLINDGSTFTINTNCVVNGTITANNMISGGRTVTTH